MRDAMIAASAFRESFMSVVIYDLYTQYIIMNRVTNEVLVFHLQCL